MADTKRRAARKTLDAKAGRKLVATPVPGQEGVAPRAGRAPAEPKPELEPDGKKEPMVGYRVRGTLAYCTQEAFFGGVLDGCRDEITEVRIPEGTARLPEHAFRDCKHLSEAILPASLRDLGRGCFEGCTGLRGIRLPDRVDYIPPGCFSGCTGLASVRFPAGLKTVDEAAFENCKSLQVVALPDRTTRLGRNCFAGCGALTEARLPDDLELIAEGCFKDCGKLSYVDFPAGLKAVRAHAFENCGSLERPRSGLAGVDVGADAFRFTKGMDRNVHLTSIHGETVTVPYEAFDLDRIPDKDLIRAIRFPEGIERLDRGPLAGLANLGQVTVPASVRNLSAPVAMDCPKLGTVKFMFGELPGCDRLGDPTERGGRRSPDYVGAYARVLFPKCGCAAQMMHDYAGEGRTMFMPERDPEADPSLVTYRVPTEEGSLFGTRTCTVEEFFSDVVKKERRRLTSVILPEGLEDLPPEAFAGCGKLEDVRLPESLRSIGMRSFAGCRALNAVAIPRNVREIPRYCFQGCWNLTEVSVLGGLDAIQDGAFHDAANFRAPGAGELGPGVKIGRGAFDLTAGRDREVVLTSDTGKKFRMDIDKVRFLPADLRGKMAEIEYPEGLEAMTAPDGLPNLRRVVLPESVRQGYAPGILRGCGHLESVVLRSGGGFEDMPLPERGTVPEPDRDGRGPEAPDAHEGGARDAEREPEKKPFNLYDYMKADATTYEFAKQVRATGQPAHFQMFAEVAIRKYEDTLAKQARRDSAEATRRSRMADGSWNLAAGEQLRRQQARAAGLALPDVDVASGGEMSL